MKSLPVPWGLISLSVLPYFTKVKLSSCQHFLFCSILVSLHVSLSPLTLSSIVFALLTASTTTVAAGYGGVNCGKRKQEDKESADGKSSVRCGKTSNATIPSGGPSFKIYFDMEDTEGNVCDGSAWSVFTLPDNEQGKFKAKSIWGVSADELKKTRYLHLHRLMKVSLTECTSLNGKDRLPPKPGPHP